MFFYCLIFASHNFHYYSTKSLQSSASIIKIHFYKAVNWYSYEIRNGPCCRVTCLEGERDRGVTLCFHIKPLMVTNRGPNKTVTDVDRTSLEHHLAHEVFRESFGVFTKAFDKLPCQDITTRRNKAPQPQHWKSEWQWWWRPGCCRKAQAVRRIYKLPFLDGRARMTCSSTCRAPRGGNVCL